MTVDPAAERLLQQRLAEAAREAGQAAARLQEYHRLLSPLCVRVTEVVGGSSRGIDRELVACVTDANRRIHAAVGALTHSSISGHGSRW